MFIFCLLIVSSFSFRLIVNTKVNLFHFDGSKKERYFRYFSIYFLGEGIESRTMRIGSLKCNLICLPWPLTFIIHFKVYRMYILGQPSALNVILRLVMFHWPWNWIVKPSQKEWKTHLFYVTLKAIGVPSQCDLSHIHLLYKSFRPCLVNIHSY